MNTEELTAEDLLFLPAGSVVEFLEPNGEPRYYETTKHKNGLWDCTFCPENHTSRDIASFKMKMRLKEMGDPEVGETIVAEHVGVANHFPVGTRLQDVDRYDDVCWQRVDGGWVYDPEDFFGNPDRTPSSLKEDCAPYTVIPKDETQEAEKEETVKTYPREEATKMTDKRFIDDRGGLWGYSDGFWYFGMSEKVLQDKIDGKQAGITWKSLPIGGSEFYTLAPEPEEDSEKFSASEASRMRGSIFRDDEGDFWKNFDGNWKYINEDNPRYFNLTSFESDTLSEDFEPYTFVGYKDDDMAGENEVPRFKTHLEEFTYVATNTVSVETEPEEKPELPLLNEKGDAPEKKDFTAAEASRMRGVIFEDASGDFWKNLDGYWKFRSMFYPKYLSIDEVPSRTLSSDYEPYTFLGYKDDELDVEDGVPRFTNDQEKPKKAGLIDAFETSVLSSLTATPAMEYNFSTDAGPAFSEEVKGLYRNEDIEVEKTPTITESFDKIAKSLERIANALEGK